MMKTDHYGQVMKNPDGSTMQEDVITKAAKEKALCPSDATACSRLARCSVCGKITDTWDSYGSPFLEEEYPWECVYVCSIDCFEAAEDKLESGQWKLPKLKKVLGGAAHDISKPRKGYDAQPTQATLIKSLIHAANPQVTSGVASGSSGCSEVQ